MSQVHLVSKLCKPDFIIPLKLLSWSRSTLPSLFFILFIIRTNSVSLLFVLFFFQHSKVETMWKSLSWRFKERVKYL